jgi:hypothetical protein
VVVTFNPDNPNNADRVAAFRAHYGIPDTVQLVGGFQGQLDNAGESVRLERPDEPPLDEPEFIPRLLEDQIDYDELAPWPPSADGEGDSLTRTLPAALGTLASSWYAATPSPGSVGVLSTLPLVSSVVINGAQLDPADLPSGPQPVSWQIQRSDLRSLVVTFNSDMQAISTADVRLTNLGVDAPVDDDVEVVLQDNQLQTAGNQLTISFEHDQLPDGVYQIELLPTIVSQDGTMLDGDRDGAEGGAFVMRGDAVNRFHKLTGDWNGDAGTTIFDFPTLSYWFGTLGDTFPKYLDLNDDGGVSIFDFSLFALAFNDKVVYPTALQTAVPAQAAIQILVPSPSNADLTDTDLPAAEQQPVLQQPAAEPLPRRLPARSELPNAAGQRSTPESLDDGWEGILELIAADVWQRWR